MKPVRRPHGSLNSGRRVIGGGKINGEYREKRRGECRTCGKRVEQERTFCAYCAGE